MNIPSITAAIFNITAIVTVIYLSAHFAGKAVGKQVVIPADQFAILRFKG